MPRLYYLFRHSMVSIFFRRKEYISNNTTYGLNLNTVCLWHVCSHVLRHCRSPSNGKACHFTCALYETVKFKHGGCVIKYSSFCILWRCMRRKHLSYWNHMTHPALAPRAIHELNLPYPQFCRVFTCQTPHKCSYSYPLHVPDSNHTHPLTSWQ